MADKERLIIGISGASGVIYGIELLRILKTLEIETHLILTPTAIKNMAIETDYTLQDIERIADFIHDNSDLEAPLSSGSFLTKGMIIAPCSIKTLSGVANSFSENLLLRAADVTLKESRKLLLMVRETPLHRGHLRIMDIAAMAGALIFPPVPAFYHHPRDINDIINQTLGKILDYFEINHQLFRRWGNSV